MKLVQAFYPGSARDALRPPTESPAPEAGTRPKDRHKEEGRML